MENRPGDARSKPPGLVKSSSSSTLSPGVRKKRSTRFAAVVRWLHIYLSLLSFAAVLFFSVTGITLNHPTWFGADEQRTRSFEGNVQPEWVRRPTVSSEKGNGEEPDYSREVDQLAVVEFLRSAHGVRGSVAEFRVDEFECLILFKGPGYSVDATVNRESGKYTATETAFGVLAVFNDLHKGRDTGRFWSWVIDVTAILMTLVSLTGLLLIFYLRRRRPTGILTTVAGGVLFGLIVWWCW